MAIRAQKAESCNKQSPHATNILGSGFVPADDLESLFTSSLVEHGGIVLKVARAYTLAPEDCQDLVQEILLQAWRSMPTFRRECGMSTWLYRVALNTALGWHRKEQRRRISHEPIFAIDDIAAAGPDSAQQAAQREAVERLYAAIRQLPKADAALVLLYLDDFTYRQMADVLGISENNVGVKLNRARKALAELMKDQSDES
jgi:RNA polymerase sigma-70 factor (ECF subfamily)